MSGSEDVNLKIFIASVIGGENLMSFTTASSTSADHQSLAFNVAEKNGRFGRIQSQRRGQQQRKETSIPVAKDSESQSKKQSHPSELSEN